MGDHGPPTPTPQPFEAIRPITGLAEESQKEVTVLVTGFGPFKTFPLNPSHLIASTLSSPIPPTKDAPHLPTIKLIVYPTPIRVSYPTVRALIPPLLASAKPDFVLNIGMAGGRNFYTVETRAHRDGYKLRDVDGNDMEDDSVWRDGFQSPEILYSDLNAGGDVYERWRRYMEGLDRSADVRVSDDAGRYLCDFIYYSTLVEAWREEKDMKGLFLHVPGDTDEAAVERGRRVAVGLIRAMVESWCEEEARKEKVLRREERKGLW